MATSVFFRGFRSTGVYLRLTLLMAALCLGAAPGQAQTHLSCSFDDQPVNEPIGTGGPSEGEPISVSSNIEAVVREGPLPSACLAIQDAGSFSGDARFEFLDGAELHSGEVRLETTLRFQDRDNYFVRLREKSSSADAYVDVLFDVNGVVRVSNDAGMNTSDTPYDANHTYTLEVVLYFDPPNGTTFTGTYEVYLEGFLITETANSTFEVDDPFGSVLVGCLSDGDTDGTFCIDNITVTQSGVTAIDDSGSFRSWGMIKNEYR